METEESKSTPEVVFDLNAATAPVLCNVIQIPHGLKAAMRTPEWPKWHEAMKTQFGTLRQKGAYKMVLRKQMINGARVLPNSWVYTIKTNDDGTTTFKARLVIGGHLQKKGIDYGETFASVVKFASVRLVLAIATRRGWRVHKVDFVAAFLNSLLQEKVYMRQIPGFEDGTERVLELIKALFGLKQSPREWQKKLREILGSMGFKPLQTDSSLYTDGNLIIPVYVDDLLVTGPDESAIIAMIKRFQEGYDIKNFGRMQSILGMEWERNMNTQTSYLTQKRYTQAVLEKFGMSDCRPQSTPAIVQKEDDFTGLLKETGPYLEAVGSLIYLSTCTRPDIALAVSTVARKMQAPTERDWMAVKRIFRFLKGTEDHGIRFDAKGEEKLTLYADADFGGPEEQRRSRSGYVVFYGNSPISWFTKLQPGLPATSTVEAEFRSAATGTQELLWLQHLMGELGSKLKLELVTSQPLLKEDNQGAIAAMRNDVQHSRLKHVELKYFFIKQVVEEGEMEVDYCPTSEQIADLLTKPLGRQKFEYFSRRIGAVSSRPQGRIPAMSSTSQEGELK